MKKRITFACRLCWRVTTTTNQSLADRNLCRECRLKTLAEDHKEETKDTKRFGRLYK